ncbi:MAG TPA: molybdopterin dinucleotide binding domain-containing protein, partial [Thermomicrobiales bacterium]|nr:molybdopterin dinucleotide binding domain-containing protein [Thermomicrobiales bacterium]
TSGVPFADLQFPTPSGKVELYSERMIASGVDPLPDYHAPAELSAGDLGDSLVLISGAAHHYVSSSLGNLPTLMRREGTPSIEIHPLDAEKRGIEDGNTVLVSNDRGFCYLRAVITPDVLPGVAVSPKGQWAHLSPDGRNVNWITPDALADVANQSTFHSNLVRVSRVAGAGGHATDKSAPFVTAEHQEEGLLVGDA